ncbi:MAG: DsbA family protein [Mariprofundus sp.]|nr:DsbA family protein [Mariprofundus sp.]
MNKPIIDFYFDFISPYSYLAATQIKSFEIQHGITFHWLPVNLPRLMKESGNISPVSVKKKALYSLRDLKRWAAFLELPFKMIRPGSFDSRPAMRIAGALEGDQRTQFCVTLFEAIWSGSVDMKGDTWLTEIIESSTLPRQWLELDSEAFEENTKLALKTGAFGVPTFVLHTQTARPELFFGLDHMNVLARSCDLAKL